MITVEEHQKTLSAKGINLPNDEVQKLLDLQYKFANIFFDFWVMKTKPNAVVVGAVAVHQKVVVHTKNGNFVAESYTFAYAYSY